MKITDITEERYKTQVQKDRYGNRIRNRVPYQAKRKVKTVMGGRRFGHFFIDLIVMAILNTFISGGLYLLFSSTDISIPYPFDVAIDVGLWLFMPLYYFLFENATQQTPGKMLLKNFVIDEYGNAPTTKQLMARSIIRFVPFEIFSCLGERGWHDTWSNTYVVSKEEMETLKRLIKEQSGTQTMDALVSDK